VPPCVRPQHLRCLAGGRAPPDRRARRRGSLCGLRPSPDIVGACFRVVLRADDGGTALRPFGLRAEIERPGPLCSGPEGRRPRPRERRDAPSDAKLLRRAGHEAAFATPDFRPPEFARCREVVLVSEPDISKAPVESTESAGEHDRHDQDARTEDEHW
jgi:hypothetical protein